MRRSGRRRGARRVNNQPTAVTVVDGDSSVESSKLDRIISSLHASESDVMVLCSGASSISTGATGFSQLLDHGTIIGSDDFQSFAAQFQTYNIQHIRFDIYDTAPNQQASAFWSTFHLVNNVPAAALADVLDRPDCKSVPPGTGKVSLTWSAKSPQEKLFQTINGTIGQPNGPTNYGGLISWINATSTPQNGKFQVIFKAVVHFRGRI